MDACRATPAGSRSCPEPFIDLAVGHRRAVAKGCRCAALRPTAARCAGDSAGGTNQREPAAGERGRGGGRTPHPPGPPQGDLVAEPGPGTPLRARRSVPPSSGGAGPSPLPLPPRAAPSRLLLPPPQQRLSHIPRPHPQSRSLFRAAGEWWVDERVGREGDDFGCWLAILTSLFSHSSHSSVLFSLAWGLGHRGEDGDGF